MNLLLVENHRLFAETVTAEFLGDHSVTLVATVMEALDLYRGGSFDAVLVDYDLDDLASAPPSTLSRHLCVPPPHCLAGR